LHPRAQSWLQAPLYYTSHWLFYFFRRTLLNDLYIIFNITAHFIFREDFSCDQLFRLIKFRIDTLLFKLLIIWLEDFLWFIFAFTITFYFFSTNILLLNSVKTWRHLHRFKSICFITWRSCNLLRRHYMNLQYTCSFAIRFLILIRQDFRLSNLIYDERLTNFFWRSILWISLKFVCRTDV